MAVGGSAAVMADEACQGKCLSDSAVTSASSASPRFNFSGVHLAAAPRQSEAELPSVAAPAETNSVPAGITFAALSTGVPLVGNGLMSVPAAVNYLSPAQGSTQPAFGQDQGVVDDQIKELDPSELFMLDSLGSGAQAEVYRAVWWRKFGSSTSAITVAVKRLHDSCGKRVHACESLTHKVKHPNLVKCFDATTKAPYLIVSEYCSGGSLYARLRDNKAIPLSWRQRLQILLDVSKGMEHLHASNPCILHRDLKSCNVLLSKQIKSPSDNPIGKVADFGLSKAISEKAWMTRCVGTWRWMAPEVFCSNDYDSKIDVFSFGILMFEVLSEEIPYADVWPVKSGVNPRIGLHIINGHRPNVKLVRAGCPLQVLQLMEECWDCVPAERPTFSVVRQQLQSQLELVTLYSEVKSDGSF
mmetsp:Transcript_104444/g.265105  ORF Transcript_104444/g.265105 Transcript_104444/m.265105 type:complete len:414 (-) Transcript_104444:88-1329(-)